MASTRPAFTPLAAVLRPATGVDPTSTRKPAPPRPRVRGFTPLFGAPLESAAGANSRGFESLPGTVQREARDAPALAEVLSVVAGVSAVAT